MRERKFVQMGPYLGGGPLLWPSFAAFFFIYNIQRISTSRRHFYAGLSRIKSEFVRDLNKIT